MLARPFRYPVRWLAFLAGGVPVVLVFPGPSLSYLAWFALVPGMVLFTRAATTREAVARGWWFGAGYLIAMLYWMAPEIGPGLVLLGAVMGWMWSPFAVAVSRLLRPPVSWPRALAAFIVVPSCWLIPEWIRSYQGLGGPWDLYGASQWQHPAVLALAAVGGVWLVSVALLHGQRGLTLLLGALRPAALVPRPAPAQPPPARPLAPGRHHAAPPAALAALGVAAFAAAAGSGPLAFALTPPFPAVRQVTIALVQPGVVDDPVQRVDASETLTAEFSAGGALAGDKPDLIVWGESSVADDLTLDHRALLRDRDAVRRRTGAEILVSQDATIAGRRRRPREVGGAGQPGRHQGPVREDAAGAVRRVHPVPPAARLADQHQQGGRVQHGARHRRAPAQRDRPRGPRRSPSACSICFESAFPDMSRVETDLGAQLIVYQSSTLDVPGHLGTRPARVPRRRARRGDRPAGRAGRADRGHGGLRRPRQAARLARPGRQRRGHGPALSLPARPRRPSTTRPATTSCGPASPSPCSPRWSCSVAGEVF